MYVPAIGPALVDIAMLLRFILAKSRQRALLIGRRISPDCHFLIMVMIRCGVIVVNEIRSEKIKRNVNQNRRCAIVTREPCRAD
jgi:hypothetical protein